MISILPHYHAAGPLGVEAMSHRILWLLGTPGEDRSGRLRINLCAFVIHTRHRPGRPRLALGTGSLPRLLWRRALGWVPSFRRWEMTSNVSYAILSAARLMDRERGRGIYIDVWLSLQDVLLGGVASSHVKVQRPLPEYELLQVQASCRSSRLGKQKLAMSASQIVGNDCFHLCPILSINLIN